MDVIFCTSEFPPGPGGIGMQAYALSMEFYKRGASIHVITAARKEFGHEDFDKSQPFKITRYDIGSSNFYKLYTHLKLFWCYRKKAPYFILSGSAQQLLAFLIRLIFDAKIIQILHGHEVLMVRGIKKELLKASLRWCNYVIAVSEFSKNILLRNGIDVPVRVIPNGVYIKEDSKVTRNRNHPVHLITVGSVTHRKGQINVVHALPFIKQIVGSVEYHLVGIPFEKKVVFETANNLGVADVVFIHGVLADIRRDEILSNSHIFMMLSQNLQNGDVEGFGIAVLEANAFGIPAIGSRDTGVEQVIKHGVTGLLVNPLEPLEVACAVKEILNNYSEFSENSKRWASEHRWEQISERYWEMMIS
jgi:phosphatidylinositol alpha-1,6-mannosyltransferase